MTASGARPEAGFARETAILAAGLVASQAVLLAVMPLWSRLYGPEQFAALGVWTAVSSTVATLVLLRYDSAIVVAAHDAEARALRRLGLALAIGGGLLLLVVALLLPARALDGLGLAPLDGWLAGAIVAGVLSALMASSIAWLNRGRAYGRISATRLTLAIVVAAMGSLLGWWWGGSTAGLLVAQLCGATAALLALPWKLSPHSGARAAARRHRDAARFLWPAALLDVFTQQLPVLLVAAWFGAHATGQFSLAWRVLAMPALMLAAAAGSVFYQRFARALDGPSGDVLAARAMILRTWRVFLVMGAAPALIIALAGEPLFAMVFGEGWREAGLLASAMVPLLLAMATSSPTSGAIVVLGQQRWAPLFGIAMLIYRPAAFWVGARAGSLPLAIALWTMCEVVAIALYNRMLLRALARRQNLPCAASS